MILHSQFVSNASYYLYIIQLILRTCQFLHIIFFNHCKNSLKCKLIIYTRHNFEITSLKKYNLLGSL